MVSLLTAAAVIAGLVTVSEAAMVAVAPAASATTGATGTAGLFVPTSGRVLNTTTDGAMTASVWRAVQVGGNAGVPTTGVSAVQVTFTAVNATQAGNVDAAMGGHTSTVTNYVNYNVGQTISNAGVLPVSSDGKINVMVSGATGLYIDVQGYFTAGTSTAAGGYVPLPAAVTLETTSSLSAGTTASVPVGGLAGVPANASSVMVNFVALNSSTAAAWFIAYASDATRPSTSYNVPASQNTAVSAAVSLGADGKMNVYMGAGGPMAIGVEIEGYFTPATSGSSSGQFTPAAARAYDSRTTTALAAGETRTVAIAGHNGVPLVGSGISALALDVAVLPGTGSTGHMQVFPDDGSSTSALEHFYSTQTRSDFMVIRPGVDGGIKFQNSSGGTVNLVVDVEGWYTNVGNAVPANQTRTQKFLTLQANAGGGGSWVTYQYRKGSTGTFTNVPVSNVTVPGTTTHPTAWPVVSNAAGTFDPYTWDLATTVAGGDQLVQVQACYGASSTDSSPVCSMPTNIQLAAHAFGDSYDTQQVGPGTLATLTGDYNIAATDVTESSYLGGLSVGRSFTTLEPAPDQNNAAGVFGPGWTSDLSGPASGDGAATVTDNSATQGYLTFTDPDGSATLYQATTTVGVYPTSFTPVADAAGNGTVVSKTSATTIVMTDSDGTKTTWTNTPSPWHVSSVVQAASADTTSYTFDSATGLPTRILGAVPPGVTTCGTAPDTTRGCRSLTFSYTTITVAGTAKTRLAGINLSAYNPATSAMAITPVASYSYDSNGRLAQEWDPRITPNLKTSYTYDGNGRLATITPPGLATWTLSYDTTGRLSTTSRPDPSGTTATSTVIYGAPFTGTGAPVDVGAAASATWGQTGDPAATGTAVFGPNHTPSGTTPATVTGTDWPYATLDFLDANGRNVNTANYGAGAWQTDATNYDGNGNTVWQLTPGNRVQSLSPTTDTDPAAAAATSSAARAALLASTTVYNPLNPAEVTDSFGPIHQVTLRSGTVVDARTHDATMYDEGAPADGTTYMLPTTQSQSGQTLDGIDHDTVTTHLGYAAINTGDTTGWSLHQATSSTVQMGATPSAADLTTTTRYNPAGQVIKQRLPGGSSGGDARSTLTSYYTATATGTCAASPDQAGLVCTVGPAAQPTTGNPLPVTTTTYNMYGQPLTVTAVAGTTTKTTTNTYDTSQRRTGSNIAVTPAAAGGTSVPAITNTYDPATGLPTTSSAGGQTLTTGYDNLGHVTSYTDATGNTSTTGYDTSGRTTSVNDGKAITSYTYDSATEHRGLPTGENIGAGPAPSTFTATYNPDGQLATEIYPTGLEADRRYDNTGTVDYLNYVQGTTSWLTFATTHDAQGHITTQSSNISAQHYTYDNDGRLTVTQDTVPTSGSNATCTTRTYTFDQDSNRTALNSYPDGGGTPAGNCSTSTTPATTTSSYDQADRLTNAGYVYDTLGRTTTIPAGDANGTASKAAYTGNLTVGYYANDMVASQSQTTATRTFTLDPQQNRVASMSDGTNTTTDYYSNSYDSPNWTLTQPTSVPDRTPANTTWTRNLLGIDGTLVGTQSSTGTVTLQIQNLRDDIVATVNDDAAATSPATTSEATEFGIPRNPATAPETYGWLGAQQRSTDLLGGLTLMGVRLYNPATGRFLSTDQIYQGTPNPYDYVADPIDNSDTSGLGGFPGCRAGGHNVCVHRHAPGLTRGTAQIITWIFGTVASAACMAAEPCGVIAGIVIASTAGGLQYVIGNAGKPSWQTLSFIGTVIRGIVVWALGRR